MYQVIKFLFLIIFIFTFSSRLFSGIVLDKDNILITDIELNEYKKIHQQFTGEKINNQIAIKNLYLLERVLRELENKNPNFIENLDQILLNEYGEDVLSNTIIRNYFRFSKIRNEFILNYYQNDLKEDDIVKLFKNFDQLPLPLSLDGCITIEKVLDLRNNNSFIKNFYDNIKTKSKDYQIQLDNNLYDICFNNNQLKIIEKELINLIVIKTELDFEKFIYGQHKIK